MRSRRAWIARGISSKLRGSIRQSSATEVLMPGMPMTLVPANGSLAMPKSVAIARAPVPELRLALLLPALGWESPAS